MTATKRNGRHYSLQEDWTLLLACWSLGLSISHQLRYECATARRKITLCSKAFTQVFPRIEISISVRSNQSPSHLTTMQTQIRHQSRPRIVLTVWTSKSQSSQISTARAALNISLKQRTSGSQVGECGSGASSNGKKSQEAQITELKALGISAKTFIGLHFHLEGLECEMQ